MKTSEQRAQPAAGGQLGLGRQFAWWATETEINMAMPQPTPVPVTIACAPQNVTVDLLRTAIIVIDMQNDFCAPGGWVDHIGGDYRPGMQAAAEHRIHSPLAECGITKAEVRQLAAEWNLPVWDKPATPCLSSRIAYGEAVTPEKLAMKIRVAIERRRPRVVFPASYAIVRHLPDTARWLLDRLSPPIRTSS